MWSNSESNRYERRINVDRSLRETCSFERLRCWRGVAPGAPGVSNLSGSV
jgi:hypothetical protein